MNPPMDILITPGMAHRIFDTLIRTCGATENHRQYFCDYVTRSRHHHFLKCSEGEYRFGGILGSGGKFDFDRHQWKVTYYPEDRTGPREAAVSMANEELAHLRRKAGEGCQTTPIRVHGAVRV